LQGRLYTPLVAGQSYCVTFYVVRMAAMAYANNNIGAYLDNGSIDTASVCHNYQTEYTPQILDTSIITDTLNWTKIQGSFIANGTERVITIGNFFDTAHTEHIRFASGDTHGMYLVDDVSVIASNATAYAGRDTTITLGDTAWLGVDINGAGMPCYWYMLGGTSPIDSGGSIAVSPTDTITPTTYVVSMDLCGTVTYDTVVVTVTGTTGVSNLKLGQFENLKIYPNPSANNITIEGAQGCMMSIFNILGQMVFEDNITNNKQTESISCLINGVYTIQLINSNGYKKNIQLLKQ